MPISADLGQTLEAYVTQLVSTGRYGSKSEVLREGVRLLQERETRLAALNAALARGLADAEAGRVVDGDEFLDQLEAKYEAMAAEQEQAEREASAAGLQKTSGRQKSKAGRR
ncbi:addiction module antitoxin [Azorhizobium oxalatiphilum]|uniref:Addiction module antitoxin n=1 Tax=Azorhizobium oxalatiphilum TaxID=980631 RepID=A0A917F883_9HYPH|nr:addiction module antitoxin [Azorhizobium oxalatiphilum]